MNKLLIAIGIVAIIAVATVFLLTKDNPLNIGAVANESASHNATTTGSYSTIAPVKVLSTNSGRTGAVIQNVGATDVYVYFLQGYDYNFTEMATSTTSITSTVTTLNGMLLTANGGSWEFITSEWNYLGDVWVSSTANGIQINTTEFYD